MDPFLTVIAGNARYCTFCLEKLAPGEECHCKGAEKARLQIKATAQKNAEDLPNHKFDRPPRGYSK